MNVDKYTKIINDQIEAQKKWRTVPAPVRGELIRKFGNKLRENLVSLGKGVTRESKKILVEGIGEIQEVIDMCDFAVGLSRQLYGKTMPSERQDHRLQEVWNPIGVVGVITAFNFPVAPWGWNFCLAIVCGNSVVWKPSPKTMEVSYLCKKIWDETVETDDERKLLEIIDGDVNEAKWMAQDKRINLLSATGSCEMGKALAPLVAERMGKGLYELGGNNAMVVSEHANLDLAVRAIVFSAVGTCGQRCTTLRRLIVHESKYIELIERLRKSYSTLPIGNPIKRENLVGPLINNQALDKMQSVLKECKEKGYAIHGGEPLPDLGEGFVKPAIVEVPEQCDLVKTETFAPILYTMKYNELDEAIALQNDVDQGLSSCIFTDNIQEAETFISAQGSDCGIVNINIGPSGAEIGGAFGGEKDTGGGRESGSDAWKQYMKRTTVTTNYGKDLPLAQGITFDA
ncbi:MAG: delta-1-piperideine-6-carboxylate dehydrogenase [Euryarchaeota archaeon]|nr:delta-1-piperideine-6-carboxylate dehydrogenase [Euryarchaeota archaeon]